MQDKYYKIPSDTKKPLLILGDAFQEIKMFPNNSIDSIISDLPYLISFMDLSWDKHDINTAKSYINFFKEAMRVLKPGGKLAIFTGAINYDLFVNWSRSAGFWVNPQIAWIYTSGMPHGINIVKYLIKQDHLDIAVPWTVLKFKLASDGSHKYKIKVEKNGKTKILSGIVQDMFRKFEKCKRSTKTSKDLLLSKLRYNHPKYFGYSVITYEFKDSDKYKSGKKYRALFRNRSREELFLEGECTPFMEKFDGFNSALKPALEPIANLQKPFTEGSVVKNMKRWGVGAYNIKDAMIPLEGMENLDVKAFIRDMKAQIVGFDNKTVNENVIEGFSSNIHQGQKIGSNKSEALKKVLEDIEGLSGRNRTEDLVFGGTTIRDRLNSGGGDNNELLQSALKDIKKQTFGTIKATDGRTFKNTTIPDRFNSGGGSNTKVIDKITKDLERQVVGFKPKENKIYTFDEGINDSIHAHGSSKAEAINEAVKFIKGSHHIHGSTGSGIFKMNREPKSTKKNLDKIIKGAKRLHQKGIQATDAKTFSYEGLTKNEHIKLKAIEGAKELHRTTMMKGSGSGILGINSEKDFEEPEMRKLGLGIETTGDMLKRVKMEDMSSRMLRTNGTYKQNKENGILTKSEAIKLKKDLKDQTTRHDPQKHKGAIFGSADMPMDNKQFAMLTFFDKMLGRYPSNVMISEKNILGKYYNKIFLVPKPTPREKLKGIPSKYHDELHKTVKPRRLMSQLVKLLTPRGGICADFFMGSGTTIMECVANDIRGIGIEIDETYFRIAKYRIKSIKAIQKTIW